MIQMLKIFNYVFTLRSPDNKKLFQKLVTVWPGECSWEYTPPNSLTRQKNYRGPETLGMSGTTLGSRNFQGLETHDMQSMFASTGLQ